MSYSYRQPSLLHRLTAVLGVALVVLLDLLVASPGLHGWVHHHEVAAFGWQTGAHSSAGASSHQTDSAPVGHPDHHCAVTLFAHGVVALLFVCLLLLLAPPACRAVWRPSETCRRARPRYWHLPAVGPPLV